MNIKKLLCALAQLDAITLEKVLSHLTDRERSQVKRAIRYYAILHEMKLEYLLDERTRRTQT